MTVRWLLTCRGKVGFRRFTKLRVRVHDLILPVEPGSPLPQVGQPTDLLPIT